MPDISKADPITEVEPRRDWLREGWLGAAVCTRWMPLPNKKSDPEQSARALVFVPIAGLVIGTVLALCDHAEAALLPRPIQSALTIALAAALSGGLFVIGFGRTASALMTKRPRDPGKLTRWAGAVAASAILAAEIFALWAIAEPPARARAIVLAMLLSRWAIVPIGYGLKPLEQTGLGIPYFGGIRFSEFAVSSVIALGLAMGLYDVVGLAAIVAVAITILGVRLLLSRRLAGAGGTNLAAGAACCELIVIAVVAAIAKM